MYYLLLRQTARLPAAVKGHDAAQCLPMMLSVVILLAVVRVEIVTVTLWLVWLTKHHEPGKKYGKSMKTFYQA